VLPPLYTAWLARALAEPLPEEARATCGDCAMRPRPGDAPGELTFDPVFKCCTYHPDLPSFSVGQILAGGAGPGRAAVERRVAAGGEGVTPLGVAPPERVRAALNDARATTGFGRAAELACPYLDGAGGCGIWPYREAVCASWFCKHEHGWRSVELWRWAQLLLQVCERRLAAWAAARLGASGEDWGAWAGRAADFYRAAAELVAPLDWDAVAAIGGIEVAALVREVRAAQARLHGVALPEKLRTGDLIVLRAGPGPARVIGHRPSDPLDLPGELLAQVLAQDGSGRPAGVDDATLERLCDHELLVPAATLVRRRG
jgi:hypothetical protein